MVNGENNLTRLGFNCRFAYAKFLHFLSKKRLPQNNDLLCLSLLKTLPGIDKSVSTGSDLTYINKKIHF